MKLTLYYAPVACSLVPYLALSEAGADFDVCVVDFKRGAHLAPEFLALNPAHKIPVLVIDGEPLTENVALLLWIANRFPDAQLIPRGGLDEFKVVAFLNWCSSGIHPHLTPNALPKRYCDLPDSESSVRRCAQALLREDYAIAENRLAGRDWFFKNFSAADIYFFWCFRRGLKFGMDLGEFNRCTQHFDRMCDRPSVRKLLQFEGDVIAGV